MKINNRVFFANTKALREDKGWSQPEISEKLGINYRSYNNLERGFATKMPKGLASKIAELFETTVEELSMGDEPDEPLIDPEIVKFWNNAKARREELGLSQATIAERIGIHPKNYQAKEVGRAAKLPKDLALKVAEALECTVEELRGDESKTINEEDVNASKTEDSIKTETLNNKPLCDISHLPPTVQRFISDKANANLIIEFVFEHK